MAQSSITEEKSWVLSCRRYTSNHTTRRGREGCPLRERYTWFMQCLSTLACKVIFVLFVCEKIIYRIMTWIPKESISPVSTILYPRDIYVLLDSFIDKTIWSKFYSTEKLNARYLKLQLCYMSNKSIAMFHLPHKCFPNKFLSLLHTLRGVADSERTGANMVPRLNKVSYDTAKLLSSLEKYGTSRR